MDAVKLITALFQEKKQIIKFGVVGFSAFLIDFSILHFLVYVCHFKLTLFGFALAANIISTVTATLFGFLMQRNWAFQADERLDQKKQLLYFVGLQSVNLIFYNTLIFNLLVKFAHLPVPVGKITVISIQMVTSYLCMRFFIFNRTARENA